LVGARILPEDKKYRLEWRYAEPLMQGASQAFNKIKKIQSGKMPLDSGESMIVFKKVLFVLQYV
jgi:hypothetical protein